MRVLGATTSAAGVGPAAEVFMYRDALESKRMRDPYQTLGMPRSATEEDIKKGFRRLAKQLHPDANKNDPRTAKHFAELNAAHAILGNRDRRQAFDRGEIDADGRLIRRRRLSPAPRRSRAGTWRMTARMAIAALILAATPTLVGGSLSQGDIGANRSGHQAVLSGIGTNDAYASAALTDQPYRRVLARPASDAGRSAASVVTRAYILVNARAMGRLQQAQDVKECGLRSEQVDQLIKLGEKFLAQGDVGTARRLLERASRARDARATLMLGATYDPDGLRRMGVVGIQPDLAQAHFWYTRALEFGCREASLRLMALAQLNR
jgi:hypothetical protein